MTTIRLFADDQKLKVAEQPCVVSGGRNSTTLRVKFNGDWSDYEKSAVFYTTRDDKVYEVLLNEGECTVPHEVLSLTADLFIGVRGVSSEHQAVKTTSLVKYKVEKGAPVGDGTTVEPTPDVYQQILMRLNDLEVGAGDEVDPAEITRIVEGYLAEHPAEPGKDGEPGRDGVDGAPGKDGDPGEDGKSAYRYAQDGGYTGSEEEFARKLAEDCIPAPATAKVGQTIVVTEVDGDGKPVKWECADVGGGSYVLLNDIVTTEAVSSVEINQSDDGTPYNLKAIYLEVGCTQLENMYGSIGYSDNNVSMTVGNSIHLNRLAHFKASERYGMNQAEYWWSAGDSVRHEYKTDIPLLANSTPFQNITGFKLTTAGQLIKFTVKVWGVLA